MRFAALKNSRPEKCLFLLSGSQSYHTMENVSESLAGRLAILPLQGHLLPGTEKCSAHRPSFPTMSTSSRGKEPRDMADLWSMIHQGYMPGLIASNQAWETFYSSYVTTYIERDVNQLTKVAEKGDFVRFMAAVAARSSELLNYDSISRDVGVSSATVKR